MITTPKIVRITRSSYETPLVFELDPHYVATDPITVAVILGGKSIHVDLWELDAAVKKLHALASGEN